MSTFWKQPEAALERSLELAPTDFSARPLSVLDRPVEAVVAETQGKAAQWLDVSNSAAKKFYLADHWDTLKAMYEGPEVNGGKGLGLRKINHYSINPEYVDQNIKQQAGFAAEVISTAKENIRAKLEGTGVTTIRADDRPDLFPKNDQYVDKIRVKDSTGEMIERVQVKFVGNNPEQCLDKLMSGKYGKYFNDGKVDKIEIPKDFYDEIKTRLLPQKVKGLEEQLARVKADGKTEVAEGIEAKLDRCRKIDAMLEKSTVSKGEAIQARNAPEAYLVKSIAGELLPISHEAGKASGTTAAAITLGMSAADHFRKLIKGEITPKKAAQEIAQDTAKAGFIGYGTGFVSTAAARMLMTSGNELLQSAAQANVPGALVSVGVSSWSSICDFAKGEIGGKDLAKDLGNSTTGVAGSIAGSALAGAALGSVAPGAGTVVGFGAGLIGGMLGYAATSTAYKAALEHGGEGAAVLAQKAQQLGKDTVSLVQRFQPDQAKTIQEAFQTFNRKNNLPFQL